MKRILLSVMLLPIFVSTPAQASCGAGQSGGVDINVTTRQVTYYCFDIQPLNVTEAENKAKQQIEQTLNESANTNTATKTLSDSVVVNYQPDDAPTYRGIEVNATTGEIIEYNYTDEQISVMESNRLRNQAQRQAIEIARANAETGVSVCVNWTTSNEIGTECHYQPIVVSQEEIDNQYNSLIELWSPDWFEMLLSWLK